MKKYKTVWVFGDSFSTPNLSVTPKDSFWGLMAQHVGAETIQNFSWGLNSFDSVAHLAVSTQMEFDWINDLILIGIPPLWRLTVFDDFQNTQYFSYKIDPTTWSQEKMKLHVIVV